MSSDRQGQRLRKALATSIDLQERKLIDEIISLFTTRDISGADDTLRAVDLIPRDASGQRQLPRTDSQRASLFRRLQRNPAFEQGIFSKDPKSGRVSDFGFLLRFVNMPIHETIAREMLEIAESHTELHIITHGQPIVYIRINDYMRTDLMRLIPLVMLVAAIVFAINFRSTIGVLLPPDPLIEPAISVIGGDATAFLLAVLDCDGDLRLGLGDKIGYWASGSIAVDGRVSVTIDLPGFGEIGIPEWLIGRFDFPSPLAVISTGENLESRFGRADGPYWIEVKDFF